MRIVDWDNLLDEKSLAMLFPGEYAQFARPVKEGLVVFLSGLPETVQQSVFAEQAALPAGAPIAARLGQLARSCPVLHKLAQILSRERRLAPELREQFRALESLPPTVHLAQVTNLLAEELGPLDRRGITLAPPAIAEASVAVVIPFRFDDARESHEGVFKVLKPGIEGRLALELELLGCVGSHLDEKCDELRIPQLDYRETFDQIRHKLANEVLLEHEQLHLAEARALYKSWPDVHIPKVFTAHCTRRTTAMERIFGEKVTEHSLQCPHETRQLADLVARALITRPMFDNSPQAIFHSDPHPGNLLYTRDGRLAILDWSLVGRLSEANRVVMTQILLTALTFHSEKIVNLCEQLGERGNLNRSGLRQVVEIWLGRFAAGLTPGLSWLVGFLDDAARLAGLRVSGDVLLFRKSLLTLEGVVDDIGAAGHWVDDVAWREFMRHFIAELPLRPFAWPDSRQWSTRLSNADLWEATWAIPFAAARYWLAQCGAFYQNRSSAINSFT